MSFNSAKQWPRKWYQNMMFNQKLHCGEKRIWRFAVLLNWQSNHQKTNASYMHANWIISVHRNVNNSKLIKKMCTKSDQLLPQTETYLAKRHIHMQRKLIIAQSHRWANTHRYFKEAGAIQWPLTKDVETSDVSSDLRHADTKLVNGRDLRNLDQISDVSRKYSHHGPVEKRHTLRIARCNWIKRC